jgi:two-component system, NarL family, invasion response regulator UvrY
MTDTISGKIRIAIADDHAMFRKGIIKLLDTDRYQFLFDVDNGEALVEQVNAHKENLPHIIIMDIQMPQMNGYITVNWLKENYPGINILVVSVLDTEESIVRMLKLGVKGYLSKVMEPDDLYAALQSLAAGDYYYTGLITNKMVHSIQKEVNTIAAETIMTEKAMTVWNELNKRQKEFVIHACSELTYDDIAEKMCVSPKTVDGYREVVYQKFKIKNRVGLVLFAIRNGLFTA